VSTSGLPAQITTYLEHRQIATARVISLTGDASDRRYFRVQPPAGDSFVLALHAQPFAPGSLPFVNVGALFAAMPVPVPRVLGEAPELGLLALEDLGDVTLQAYIGAASASEVERLYVEAVDHITQIQQRGTVLTAPQYLPYGLAFNVEKLLWEMNYFVRHFLESYRGAQIAPATREALMHELGVIVSELAAEAHVVCHRDYHSRNLMVTGGHVVIIDFQDARLGPNTYDLVSLLRDSYVDLPTPVVDRLLDRFVASLDGTESRADFETRFDLMAMQRNLKALGTFGYQTVSRGDLVYAQYVPRTLRYIRENFSRHARFARLRALLVPLVPELE
jgi:N-acetylmuramate 1-kinase